MKKQATINPEGRDIALCATTFREGSYVKFGLSVTLAQSAEDGAPKVLFHHPLENLAIKAQIGGTSTCSNFYGTELVFHNPFNAIKLRDVAGLAKVAKYIDRKLDKMQDSEGCPYDLGEEVSRLARALGISTLWWNELGRGWRKTEGTGNVRLIVGSMERSAANEVGCEV